MIFVAGYTAHRCVADRERIVRTHSRHGRSKKRKTASGRENKKHKKKTFAGHHLISSRRTSLSKMKGRARVGHLHNTAISTRNKSLRYGIGERFERTLALPMIRAVSNQALKNSKKTYVFFVVFLAVRSCRVAERSVCNFSVCGLSIADGQHGKRPQDQFSSN